MLNFTNWLLDLQYRECRAPRRFGHLARLSWGKLLTLNSFLRFVFCFEKSGNTKTTQTVSQQTLTSKGYDTEHQSFARTRLCCWGEFRWKLLVNWLFDFQKQKQTSKTFPASKVCPRTVWWSNQSVWEASILDIADREQSILQIQRLPYVLKKPAS